MAHLICTVYLKNFVPEYKMNKNPFYCANYHK
jgi:hypothetical protein